MTPVGGRALQGGSLRGRPRRGGPPAPGGDHALLARVLAIVAVPAGYALGAVLLTATVWPHPRTALVGGCCDPVQTTWFLEHTTWAITHGHDPFRTDLLVHPAGVNLMWNAALVLPGIVFTPVTLVAGPVFTYNVLACVAVAVSAWAAYAAAGALGAGRAAALVAGTIYGFSPYVSAHLGEHLNLVFVPLPPLVVILAVRVLAQRRRDPVLGGVLLGAAAAGQVLVSEEILVLTVIGSGIALAIASVIRPADVLAVIRPGLVMLVTALGIFMILVAIPLAEQFGGPQRPVGLFQPTDKYVVDLLNLLVPTHVLWLVPDGAGDVTGRFTGGGDPETTGYMGIALIVLLTAAVSRMWGLTVVRVAGLVIVGATVCALGPHLHVGGVTGTIPLPWDLIARLPYLDNVLPARLMVLAWLGVAVVMALAVDRALAAPSRVGQIAVLGLVALALAPLVPRIPFSTTDASVPEIFTHWDEAGIAPGAVVLVAPYSHDFGNDDAMLWQAVAGDRFAMPEGYVFVPDRDGSPRYGPIPSTLTDSMQLVQERGVVVKAKGEALSAIDAQMRDRGVSAVIVGPMANHDVMVTFFRLLLGREPESIGGVTIWRDVDSRGVDLQPAE